MSLFCWPKYVVCLYIIYLASILSLFLPLPPWVPESLSPWVPETFRFMGNKQRRNRRCFLAFIVFREIGLNTLPASVCEWGTNTLRTPKVLSCLCLPLYVFVTSYLTVLQTPVSKSSYLDIQMILPEIQFRQNLFLVSLDQVNMVYTFCLLKIN